MPEFFCELFCEEMPARLQARGAEEFARLFSDIFAALKPSDIRSFHGPRRVALAADIAASIAETTTIERGPRTSAPEAALAGFLRKHAAIRGDLRQEGDFWVLHKVAPAVSAADLIADAMPGLLRRFAWPKSMRWGGTSAFTWIRPLRRICCVLAGEPIAFSLAIAGDDGHGLVAGDLSEGHRMLSPEPFRVTSSAAWLASLRQAHVIADAAERERLIAAGIAMRAAAAGVAIVADDGLISEVAGLVEWPVALLGQIDDAFMDLPAEVMQVSMRVNQRYFATRTALGAPAPYFAFIANIDAPDGEAAIIAGNERVLRARFADARHFWDQDRRTRLEARVAALDGVTFHARLGTQGARVRRLVALARVVAEAIGAPPAQAARAALLAKADLTTGMVGEFPELQGVMGSYYARHDGEDDAVAHAIREHYAPRGLADPVPASLVSAAVALADKLDQLVGFFAVDERPSGSGDPYGLRRAALGIIRIIRVHSLHVDMADLARRAGEGLPGLDDEAADAVAVDVRSFLNERLRVALKADGVRADVIMAAANADCPHAFSDILYLNCAAVTIGAFIETANGRELLAAYNRINNIIDAGVDRTRSEQSVDDRHFLDPVENELSRVLMSTERAQRMIDRGDIADALSVLANMSPAVQNFFNNVQVNHKDPNIKNNRINLITRALRQMRYAAAFDLIAT